MTVDIYIPVLVDQFAPDLGFKMIQILEEIGCKVNYNEKHTDTGDIAFKLGYWEDAKEIGEKFLKDFNEDRYVIAPSYSSIQYIRNYHNELFENSILHNQHKQLKKNTFEITEFLVKTLKITQLNVSFEGTAVIHPSCSIYKKGPDYSMHQLLEKVKGLKVITNEISNESCGCQEEFITDSHELVFQLGVQQLETAISSGANYLIVSDIECFLHLKEIQKKKDLNFQVLHVLDVLAKEE